MNNKLTIQSLINFTKNEIIKLTIIFIVLTVLVFSFSLLKGLIYQSKTALVINEKAQINNIGNSSFLKVPTFKSILSHSITKPVKEINKVVEVDRDTKVFNVYISGKNKQKVSKETKTYIEKVQKKIPELYPSSNVEILANTKNIDIEIVAPKFIFNIVVSSIISFQLTILITIFLYFKNKKITKNEIERLNIPIIGEIPKF
ncbi:hypothetical protein MKS61_08025 [Staphylococcus haemolyticus]|uniref:hypothetical protein n=1 Tax=Staphylococcus haemolyticus TaxID=1283 RepID=UPI001F0A0E03|nr:hypothetical protein [Staphylococcus haemolyticus]MCH4533004.1 hypothetical protein [Staphylococcus haemolyticus]